MKRFMTPENRKWWTLAAVSFGLFMIMLDNTVVNVALPSMQRSLGIEVSELEWVVAGYALTFGAFMLTGGKLADLLRPAPDLRGRARRSSPPPRSPAGSRRARGVLIGARVVQGLGARADEPGDALDHHRRRSRRAQRGTAIGIWAGVSALALAIGPLVGGLITEHVNWNWIFFINVPIGVIAIAARVPSSSTSRATRPHEQRPDIPGLVTSARRALRADATR